MSPIDPGLLTPPPPRRDRLAELLSRALLWLSQVPLIGPFFEELERMIVVQPGRPRHPLGLAVDNFIDSVQRYWNLRTGQLPPELEEAVRGLSPLARDLVISQYAQTGTLPPPPPEDMRSLWEKLQENPSAVLGDILSQATTRGPMTEVAEVLGSFIFDSVLNLSVGPEVAQINPALKERIRRFLGSVLGLTLVPRVAGVVAEVASLGQIETVGEITRDAYFVLGLGFITWQATTQLIDASIGQELGREARRIFRPQRFTASQVRDLLELGMLTRAEAEDYLRGEGWREEDIERVVALGFRVLSEADIWKLYHDGVLTQAEVVVRLRALGFRLEDMPLLFAANPKEDTEDVKRTSVGTLFQALKEGLLDEGKFREEMTALGYSETEIDLRVAFARKTKEIDDKQLSTTQLREAFLDNVIGEPEARHYLGQLNYDPNEIDIIVGTWKRTKSPESLRINRSTILDAYGAGIFNRARAKEKLVGVGYPAEDAETLLLVAEATDPRLHEATPEERVSAITPAQLLRLTLQGIITPEEYETRLLAAGFNAEDALLLRQSLEKALQVEPLELTTESVLRAYGATVIDRAVARQKIIGTGLSEEDTEIFIQTFETEHPEVFASERVFSTRQPTPSAIVSALQNGLINEVEAMARLVEVGFSERDAQFYIDLGTFIAPQPTKDLTKTEILNAYERLIFDRATALRRLLRQNYSLEAADVILRLTRAEPQDTDIASAFEAELIGPIDAGIALIGLGYEVAQVVEYLNKILAGRGLPALTEADFTPEEAG